MSIGIIRGVLALVAAQALPLLPNGSPRQGRLVQSRFLTPTRASPLKLSSRGLSDT